VDWYRQDQNAINPDDYWTYNDEPGRTGMMEIRYITNFYRYMDALVENNPGLMIDNCAQGGRRLDLEMMKRSIPFWNSDYGNSDSATPNEIRNINYNLSWWLPIHGGKYPIANYDYLGSSATDYRFRTAMTSCMGFDMGNALNGRNQQLMDQYYTCRELMSGEYYILDEADAGVGYEFYKADADKGYLLFFGDTGYVHGYKLKGLQANAMYSVISADTGVRRVYTGAALMTNGFTVSHAENSQSQLFYINEL
jgi:alpha-galactosidase